MKPEVPVNHCRQSVGGRQSAVQLDSLCSHLERDRDSPDLGDSDLPLPGAASRPEVCESVAVLPGRHYHVVARVGPTDDGTGAGVRTRPELVGLQAALCHSVGNLGQNQKNNFIIIKIKMI